MKPGDGLAGADTASNTKWIKRGSILAFVFAGLMVFDLMLPSQLTTDQVVEKGTDHYYSGSGTRQQQHHDIYFRTTRFKFEVNMSVFNAFAEGDTIYLYHTLIFRKPMHVQSRQENTTQTWRVAGTWPLWCIGLSAFIIFSAIVNLRYEADTARKAGIAAIISAVILLVKYFV